LRGLTLKGREGNGREEKGRLKGKEEEGREGKRLRHGFLGGEGLTPLIVQLELNSK